MDVSVPGLWGGRARLARWPCSRAPAVRCRAVKPPGRGVPARRPSGRSVPRTTAARRCRRCSNRSTGSSLRTLGLGIVPADLIRAPDGPPPPDLHGRMFWAAVRSAPCPDQPGLQGSPGPRRYPSLVRGCAVAYCIDTTVNISKAMPVWARGGSCALGSSVAAPPRDTGWGDRDRRGTDRLRRGRTGRQAHRALPNPH